MTRPSRPDVALPLAALALALALAAGNASAQLRIVTWNVTNYSDSSSGRNPDFQNAIYGVVPVGLPLAGASMSPDVFVGQEFISLSSATTFRNMLNSAPGSPGDWAMAPFVDGNDTDNALFYRTSKVTLVATKLIAVGASGNCNQPRNTMRYDVRPVGYASAGATIGIYSSHMKAQGSNAACPSGENAAGRRLIEAQAIRANAEGVDTNGAGSALPAGYNFILCGDFNITSSASAEYQALVASLPNNDGRLFDPINTPGNWQNNNAFRFVHTQDPFPSAGGMDDRFDQILTSASLLDGPGFNYIGNPAVPYSTTTWNDPNHSYRAWGNDGTSCCASGLNTSSNSFVGNSIAQSLSDTQDPTGHLPVFADFRVPAKLASPASISFGSVPQGSTAQLPANIGNAGDTALWTTSGLATLNYSLAASAGFSAPAGAFADAPGGALNSHTISMDTSTPGTKVGTLTITSDDPDTPTRILSITGTVTASNVPPTADAGPDQTILDANRDGTELVALDGSGSFDPDGTIASYSWTEGVSLLASGPTPSVLLPVGSHILNLIVTDNAAANDSDQLLVTINAPCPADLDDGTASGLSDGGVTIDDLLFFLNAFDAGSSVADLDDGSSTGTPDGGVTIDDLIYFLTRFDAGC